jgi:hypothetical protein
MHPKRERSQTRFFQKCLSWPFLENIAYVSFKNYKKVVCHKPEQSSNAFF